MATFTINKKDDQAGYLHTAFVSPGDESNRLGNANVLGVAHFCRRDEPLNNGSEEADAPRLSIRGVEQDEHDFSEIWFSSRPVQYQARGDFRFSFDGQNLFGCISFGERENKRTLDRLVYETYLRLFQYLNQLGYPHLFRMWNYIPRITQEEDDLERYRAFCLGRNRAFKETFKRSTSVMPAATGIAKNGTGRVDIYFLAHRNTQAIHLQNPRQTPAFRYPRRYGPRPPSFSRATYVPRERGRFELYVAGTASVVGSRSMYADDVRKQCDTTIENIALLIGRNNLKNYNIAHSFALKDMDSIKIYYKRTCDLPVIREICEKRFSPHSQKAYLHVDICRADLLVEIEGSIQSEKRNAVRGVKLLSHGDGRMKSRRNLPRAREGNRFITNDVLTPNWKESTMKRSGVLVTTVQ